MRPYEVMVILDAGLEDEVIRSAVDRALEVIRTGGGTPGRVDHWGRRRFAYELKHRKEGYYAVIEATAPPAAMAELERTLFLADEVLRHKVLRVPDKVAGRSLRPAPESAAPAAPEAEGDAASANGA